MEKQELIRRNNEETIFCRESILGHISNNEENSENNQNDELRFNSKSPIQLILKKFCDNSINEYIYHTRTYLEYDEEDAFIFIFMNSLVVTHLFDENENELKTNPIIFIIKFQQIYFYNLYVNETDGNHIILQFYENDFVKKSEM